jgi:hypothetical protein
MRIRFKEVATNSSQAGAEKARGRFPHTGVSGRAALPPTWGKVVRAFDDSTADVLLHTGVTLYKVGVSAADYVSVESGSAVGGKRIPPVGAKVLIVFPEGIVENAFIIASRIDVIDKDEKDTLLGDGVDVQKTVDSSGWITTFNHSTGEIVIEDGDFSMTVDKVGKSIEITDWNGNGFTLNSTGLTVVTGDAAGWLPNILPTCPFTGAPHGGSGAGIVRLKGG